MRGRIWNIDEKWLEEHYVSGMLSTREIARIIGCTKTTILRHLRYHNIPIREKKQIPSDPVERFWGYVDSRDPAECWNWNAGTDKDGYGKFWTGSKHSRAHIFSWNLHYGPIPDGELVCHHCDNPSCVNPSHLFLGSPATNTRDAIRKGRMRYGENHGRAKLTDDNVIEIAERLNYGETQTDLAKEFGVVVGTIGHIHHRRTWKSVLG